MIEIREAIDKDVAPFYVIYCQNILFTRSRKEPTWFGHCNWWHYVFKREDLYAILLDKRVIGYIRITKDTKEISIAITLMHQNKGFGSIALSMLKNKPKIAKVHSYNSKGISFFTKNNIPIEVLE